MVYIRDLQQAYNHVRELLLEKLDVEHIGGRAGRLEDKTTNHKDYRAVFEFRLKHKTHIKRLQQLLEMRDYGVRFIFGEHVIKNAPTTDLWKIMLVAENGLPSEQEESLVRALNELGKEIEGYR